MVMCSRVLKGNVGSEQSEDGTSEKSLYRHCHNWTRHMEAPSDPAVVPILHPFQTTKRVTHCAVKDTVYSILPMLTIPCGHGHLYPAYDRVVQQQREIT